MNLLTVVQRPVAAGNWREGDGIPRDVRAAVIHITEGSAASARAWFNTPPERRPSKKPSSAHFMVTRGGVVEQFVGVHDVAYGNGGVHLPTWPAIRAGRNPNDYTVSIEHEGDGKKPWPPAQLAASALLAAWLCDRFQWEPSPLTFPLHREIYALKSCPGPVFDRDDYLARVRAARRLCAPDTRAFLTGIR